MQKVQVFAYARESIDLISGIAIQKEAVERYCVAYDISIKKWYIDNDASAYKYRPNFSKMWKAIDEVDGFIVNDMSRFGRSDADLLFQFNEMRERDKRLILVKERIDTSNEESDFFIKMLALCADREGTNIRERLSAGRAYAKIHGTKSGKPMHRPAKKINWEQFDDLRHIKKISVNNIASIMGVSKSKLYTAIRQREEVKQ